MTTRETLTPRLLSRADMRDHLAILPWAENATPDHERDFETGKKTPLQPALEAIQAALEAGGIVFNAENESGSECRIRKE